MLNVNMAAFAAPVISQRRFRYLLVGLMGLAFLLGLLIYPVERMSPKNQFGEWHDGLWWAAITVTGVGYGDYVPVTFWGRMIGLVLAVLGVLAYGLILGMFTIALESTKEKYYRNKQEMELREIREQLTRIEKQNHYLMEQKVNGEK